MRQCPSAVLSWCAALSLVTASSCADEGDRYIIITTGGGTAGAGGGEQLGGEAGMTATGSGGASTGGSATRGGASGAAGAGGSGGDVNSGGTSGSGSGGTSANGGSGGTPASGGSGPGCSGMPVPCEDIQDVNNGCHAGCEDAYACLGTPRACSTWTDPNECTYYGCDWNSNLDRCEGMPYYDCEDFTGGRAECIAWRGCGWYECLGTALPCEGIQAGATCRFNPGCTWSE